MGTGMGTWMGTGMGIGMAQGWGQGWGQAGVVTDTITYRFGHSYSEGYYSYSEGQGHAHSALMSDYEINSFLSKWSCMQAESGVVSKGRACRLCMPAHDPHTVRTSSTPINTRRHALAFLMTCRHGISEG